MTEPTQRQKVMAYIAKTLESNPVLGVGLLLLLIAVGIFAPELLGG